jgi:hypothetical protein
MRSLACATALIVGSLTACTKQQTGVGVSIGVGMIVTGAIMLNSSTENSMGMGLVGAFGGIGGGVVVVSGSLIGRLLGFLDPSASRPRPRDPAHEPEGPRCVPVSPTSSSWTCGRGYVCTDDFESCEPAVGAPLRQR